jgi:spore coat polysaccharide biosynthesis protein SpsF (cytidylyltransferase family)
MTTMADGPEFLIVIQARLGSKRFPRKVLELLDGKPLLAHTIDNLKPTGLPIVVASPSYGGASDDPDADYAIQGIAEAHGAEWFGYVSGDENDVLGRFAHVIRIYKPTNVVRITADCPLIDPVVVRACVDAHLVHGADYTSNTMVRSWPDGLDCEVVRSSVLLKADQWHDRERFQEHVTGFVHNKQMRSIYKRVNVGLRSVVDTPEDLERIRTGRHTEPVAWVV